MLFSLIAMILFWSLSCKTLVVKVPPPSDNKASFPILELPIPQNNAHANYLGISGPGNFKITQIKSPVLIIEIFSRNCAHCQMATPLAHRLYLAIQARPDLKEKIKIIGIGANNDTNEVDLFRTSYNVPFPLFPDPHDAIIKKLGVVILPTFIGLKNNGDGTMEKFLFQPGAFRDANSFLAEILERAK
jgi:thiol-disulfide isomerase/thioredoxin